MKEKVKVGNHFDHTKWPLFGEIDGDYYGMGFAKDIQGIRVSSEELKEILMR